MAYDARIDSFFNKFLEKARARRIRRVRSHPNRKNKNAARVGHPKFSEKPRALPDAGSALGRSSRKRAYYLGALTPAAWARMFFTSPANWPVGASCRYIW